MSDRLGVTCRRVLAVAVAIAALAACSSTDSAARSTDRRRAEATSSTSRATTTVPAPSEYAVGSRTETFVDTSRPTPANGTFPGAGTRTLLTTIYYPATGDPGGPITEGAPVEGRGAKFPLILMSHGHTARGVFYQGLIREWVRAGYVVAAPDYPLSNLVAPGGPTINDVKNQPADATFVIDQVLALDRKPGGLGGVVDSSRIGAAGHSLGAVTTFGLVYSKCCRDRRIKAAIPMSGAAVLVDTDYFTGIRTPLLLVHGDADETVPYRGSQDAFERANAAKYLITIVGGKHSPPFLGLGDRQSSVVNHTTLDFFDAYLKGRADALDRLRTDATVPGVATLREQPAAS